MIHNSCWCPVRCTFYWQLHPVLMSPLVAGPPFKYGMMVSDVKNYGQAGITQWTSQMIGIVNISMGNLRSVENAIYELGFDPFMIKDPSQLTACTHLILPGVGAFCTASERLYARGWVDAIRDYVEAGQPLLGICLGMQLLADFGSEGGSSPGLGLIPGKVIRFDLPCEFRIPHVGWNNVEIRYPHPVFAGIKPKRDFYFVHSYHFYCQDETYILGETDYSLIFTSIVAAKNVVGVQFHPEKSQVNGIKILENFCEWDGLC